MRLFVLFVLGAASLGPLAAEPRPGDVYREFTYLRRFGEIDPGSKRPGLEDMRANMMGSRALELPSLKDVQRAEVSVEYWGGHIGTSEQKFRVNGAGWHYIQQQHTPDTAPPQCFQRTILGRATTEVPVAELKPGFNEFRFTAGPQLCNSFDWGFYWVYAFTVRLYYRADTSHPTGTLLLPESGGEIGENPTIAADVKEDGATITAVDFIGNYRDFNWEGDGVFRQWHYITERGAITHHIGTATRAPYAVRWDTTWIPDQDEPVHLAARITDSAGHIYITPAVPVTFRRTGRSVKMYTSGDVPKSFSVRLGRRKECTFMIGDDVSKARAARLVLSTWSAAHDGEMGLNGTKLVDRIGLVHNYSFDAIPVPPRLLKPAVNTYYVTSKTTEHAPEINWPGPVLLVEYAAGPASVAAAGAVTVEDLADYEGQPGFRIRTPSATYIYQKEGAGFASIRDNSGVEWVGYHPGGRSAGEFRGIPNLGDDFGHPGHRGEAGALSRVAIAEPAHARIVSERADGRWACQWDFYPTHATMTLLKASRPYWFLYEGTPAGRLDVAKGYYVVSDGTRRSLANQWSDAGADWVYFGDSGSRYVLFLAGPPNVSAPWQYWPMDGNMTVFGFGRELTCCGRYLDAAPARFTIGITEDRGFDAIGRVIRSATAN
jgi:hypothetical protein